MSLTSSSKLLMTYTQQSVSSAYILRSACYMIGNDQTWQLFGNMDLGAQTANVTWDRSPMTCCCPRNTSPLKSSCSKTAAAPFGFSFCLLAVAFFATLSLFLPAACCRAAYHAVSIGCSIQCCLTIGSSQRAEITSDCILNP